MPHSSYVILYLFDSVVHHSVVFSNPDENRLDHPKSELQASQPRHDQRIAHVLSLYQYMYMLPCAH